VDQPYKDLFERRSRLLLSIQCGSCHTRRDVFLPSDPATAAARRNKLCDVVGGRVVSGDEGSNDLKLVEGRGFDSKEDEKKLLDEEEFKHVTKQYETGEIREMTYFDECLSNTFPILTPTTSGSRGQDSEEYELKRWTVMKTILESFEDEERRACLHLRFLRFFPHVKTSCCMRWHCFRCKIKDYHSGQTCDEYQAANQSDFLTCGQCGIFLVKGDGCSSVSCVCGFSFNWNSRMEEMKSVRITEFFRSRYPDQNVGLVCAEILFDFASSPSGVGVSLDPSNTSLPEAVQMAVQYRSTHSSDVNNGEMALFRRMFGGLSRVVSDKIINSPIGTNLSFYVRNVKVSQPLFDMAVNYRK